MTDTPVDDMKKQINLVKTSVEKQFELRNHDYWREQIPERCPPVLWFGNHKAGEILVTVGLNPSSMEFFKNRNDAENRIYLSGKEKRLYVYQDEDLVDLYDTALINRVLQSYDNYYRTNPYTRWFGNQGGYNIEAFINQWNASFYSEKPVGCVHTDLFPFTTISKFSDLDEMRLRDDIFSDDWFPDNFYKLIDFLTPKYVIIFGRRSVQYFNEYYRGRLRLEFTFNSNGKKLARYGFSELNLSGKRIPVVGLSVNLGNPRGFTKKLLSQFGLKVYEEITQTSREPVETLSIPFIDKPISKSILELAFSHEKNHELANLGDGVLKLVIREHFYEKNSSAKEIQGEEERYTNNKHLASIATKLKLDKYISSSSGLRMNKNINEVYARTLEAIIGAIYRDNGIEQVRSFIRDVIFV